MGKGASADVVIEAGAMHAAAQGSNAKMMDIINDNVIEGEHDKYDE